MERAIRRAMRTPIVLFPMLVLAACGGAEPTSELAGSFAEGVEVTDVWVLGGPARAAVEGDTFRLSGLEAGVLDLRFAAGEDEVARMEIRGVEPGRPLRLRGIWFEDGEAHPTALEGEGGGVYTVNGIRMSPASAAEDIDATGTVLVVSDDGDALIVRPGDAAAADLRVVVTPGTRVQTPDGDPAEADDLEFGDSVRVVGPREGGYVIAGELVVPRDRAR